MVFSVSAVHFNHKLRGGASDSDEAFVRDFCDNNGIPVYVGACDVSAESHNRRAGIEETARVMRYEFFERIAGEIDAARIATAHNAEDNAETVLMNLIRGASLSGLSGIPPVRGNVIRPMLQIGRQQILNYLVSQKIPYVNDETNAENIYTRNKFRHLLFPLLQEINPRAVEAIGKAAALVRKDDQYLYSLAETVVQTAQASEGGLVISAKTLAALPSPVASRAFFLLIDKIGEGRGDISALHVESAQLLINSDAASGSCSLPRGIWLTKEYDDLYLTKGRQKTTFPATQLASGGRIVLMDGAWEIICVPVSLCEKTAGSAQTIFIKDGMITGPLNVRPRLPGDRIRLSGRGGSKSLKKLFIEEKIPVSRREAIPVIADGDRLVAVAGFGADEAYAALPGEDTLAITIKGEIFYG